MTGGSSTTGSIPRRKGSARRCARWPTATWRLGEPLRSRPPTGCTTRAPTRRGSSTVWPPSVDGRSVSNESIVNLPNWLPLAIRGPDGWFDDRDARVVSHHVELDPQRAVLTRRTTFEDPGGRRLALSQRRFVSLRDPHLAALETTIVAENWDGPIVVRSAIDGRVRNSGVARYDGLDGVHLEVVGARRVSDEVIELVAETTQSRIRVAVAARTRLSRDERRLELEPAVDGRRRHRSPRSSRWTWRPESRSPSRRWSPSSTRAMPPSASPPSRRVSGPRRSPATSRSCAPAIRSAGSRSGASATSSSGSTTTSRRRCTCTSSTCSRPCRTTPSASMSGCPPAGCTARPTGDTSSGTSCSCSRS